MADKYVYAPRDADKGWLLVKPETGANISIPYGLKLRMIEVKDKRDYFEIVEGVNKGVFASVSRSKSESYLLDALKHLPAGTVKFDLKTQVLFYGGHGPFNAFSGGGHDGFTPVPAGTHKLAIPAFPTKQTRKEYEKWTQFHKSWFRIGLDVSKDRFLHPGAISDGCVTVRQFIYDPDSKTPPPVGFEDLPDFAKDRPGLIGLPLPKKRAPATGWDDIYNYTLIPLESENI